MIEYTDNITLLESITVDGFFVGWPNPPTSETFKKILRGSYKVILAYEGDKLVGFINAISDGVLSSYIPLLEVLPEYQGQGVGTKLVEKMKEKLKDFYMVDILCDKDLIPYYEKLGMMKASGVCVRNYERQGGE